MIKQKNIFFSRIKSLPKLSMSYGDYALKQHNTVEYFGCYLDSNPNGESVACKGLKKINRKLNFLWRQRNYLNYLSRRFLRNALIQPHFDYRCTSWYFLPSKALKSKLEIDQNKFIRFCLELPYRGQIISSHFRKKKLASVERSVEMCTSNIVF